MEKKRSKIEAALKASSFVNSPADMNLSRTEADKVGFLLKEGGRWKSVKRRFCVLNTKQHVLYYFDSPGSDEVTGLVVLENCGVRLVPPSEAKIPFTFEMYRPNPTDAMSGNHKTYRFTASSEEDLKSWMESIQTAIYAPTPQKSSCLIGHLFVKVIAGRDLAIKDFHSSDPYCVLKIIGQDQAQNFTTSVQQSNLNPTWNEEYTFKIYCRGAKLFLVMWDEDFLSHDDFMGQKLFDIFPTLESEEPVIAWSKLEKSKSKDRVSGDIQLSLQYMSHENIDESSLDRFQDMIKWIMSPSGELLHAIYNSLETKVDAVASSLIQIFDYHNQAIRLIYDVCNAEVQSTADITTLFRTDSMATKMIAAYLNLYGAPYMREILSPCFTKMLQSPKSYEVDPNRIQSGEFLQTNVKNLDGACQMFVDAIFNSSERLPMQIREMCNRIYKSAYDKFGEKAILSVTGIIFLRFLNPAIIFPERNQLVQEPPSKEVKRGLILITKVLQNLANGVEFGGKEQFLVDMNEFIRVNHPRMIQYLTECTIIPAESQALCSVIEKQDLAREVNFIFRVIRQHRQKIVLMLPDVSSSLQSSQLTASHGPSLASSTGSLRMSVNTASGSCTFPSCGCSDFVTSLGSKRGMAVCGRCGHTAAVHESRESSHKHTQTATDPKGRKDFVIMMEKLSQCS